MDGITANFVDITNRNIFQARLHFTETVTRIEHIAQGENPSLPYLLPGFIDAHVHIESSMLIPSEFARLAVTHGTVATISDPHEIANVCGMNGVYFIIRNGRSVPFKFHFV